MNDITPKEAIANLNHIYGMVAPDMQRSLDVAIKALERPTCDLISREALKEHKVYSEERHEYVVPVYNIDNAQPVDAIVNTIEVRTKGEWIPMNPDCRGYSDYFKCSICGAYIYPNIPEKELDYNGCPYCFADMRKGGAE